MLRQKNFAYCLLVYIAIAFAFCADAEKIGAKIRSVLSAEAKELLAGIDDSVLNAPDGRTARLVHDLTT